MSGTRLHGTIWMRLHLIADDLTGALDTAAQFAADGPVPVFWDRLPPQNLPERIAIDSGTRERGVDAARSKVRSLAASLPRAEALCFAKLDSLLRGHAAAEIAAWFEAIAPVRVIVAPAFPFQGRITRGGVQYARNDGQWTAVACDLVADLTAEGLPPRLCRPGDSVPPGLSVWDAETDADLARIAAAGRAAPGPVLWCGSSGLAGALAGAPPAPAGFAPPDLPRPVLGLFGTRHPVTIAQLAASATPLLALADGGPSATARVAEALAADGVGFAYLSLPQGLGADVAARRIAAELGALANRVAPPATLIVAGGETLRGLCESLAAERLDVGGQIAPGVPWSTMRGGRFDGVRVVSKSGAFGEALLLRQLLARTDSQEFCQ